MATHVPVGFLIRRVDATVSGALIHPLGRRRRKVDVRVENQLAFSIQWVGFADGPHGDSLELFERHSVLRRKRRVHGVDDVIIGVGDVALLLHRRRESRLRLVRLGEMRRLWSHDAFDEPSSGARDAAIRHRNAVAVDEPRHEDEGGEIFIQVHAPRVRLAKLESRAGARAQRALHRARLAIERETFREEIVILHGVKDGADDARQLIVLRVREFAPDVARRDQKHELTVGQEQVTGGGAARLVIPRTGWYRRVHLEDALEERPVVTNLAPHVIISILGFKGDGDVRRVGDAFTLHGMRVSDEFLAILASSQNGSTDGFGIRRRLQLSQVADGHLVRRYVARGDDDVREHGSLLDVGSRVHAVVLVLGLFLLLKNQPRRRLGEISSSVFELHLRLPL